ncbi:MAG: rRNA ((1498)-N(3))-methyltransferase [Pseudonocardiales bacterium]|nr:rRNA ((1498)-N(3))-methyltransferase [Pseudonocardiales bacterium]
MSTPPLFFVDHLPAGPQLRLDGDEGRHAARVKRLLVGEAVLISDGLGAVADCVVAAVRPDGLELAVRDRRQVEPPDPWVVVVQALPKGERAELAVELLTELGVDEIVPWASSRSVVHWRGGRGDTALLRGRRTAREAAKQSRRPRVPVVTDAASTADVLARLASACGLLLHESAALPLASADLPASGQIVLVVGPEGGITDDEITGMTSAGAEAVRLGDPVLRTSTAGAAALAAVSVRLGRWG